ncbi:hypothetical protein NIES2100_35210 [Calothrix sp. NIES-2100]|uniref:hypothetical protein n=1 Tax=Calothrix sp. NIES-2100 TaxID=1954172 RepID=UPI000B5E3990|nr:hypothetical protein NIES2100_35210 [Calothrix sp. NIES-2100]
MPEQNLTNLSSANIIDVSPNTGAISISPQQQDKIIDAFLLQGGGIGLGVLLAIAGTIFVANWLGLKDAVGEWSKRQAVESQMLQSISESLKTLLRETTSHNDDCREKSQATQQSLRDLDYKVVSVQKGVEGIHEELKEMRRDTTQKHR